MFGDDLWGYLEIGRDHFFYESRSCQLALTRKSVRSPISKENGVTTK